MNTYYAFNNPINFQQETRQRITITDNETWAETNIYAYGEWAVVWRESVYIYAELFQTKQAAEIFHGTLKSVHQGLDKLEIVPVS